jgi:creatinine amidohydrolase
MSLIPNCRTLLRTAACLGLWVAFPSAPASAQEVDPHRHEVRPIAAVNSVWMEDLTWMEIRDLMDAGTRTVIVSTGGLEQNGPYLTTGKHNVVMKGQCEDIARKLGNTLCAPIVAFVPEGNIDPPSGHMLFPGTISVSQETYRALLADIVASLLVTGFTDVVLLGDSGGNQGGQAAVAEMLNERYASRGGRVHHVVEFYRQGWAESERFVAEDLGLPQTRDDGYHDDSAVTLLMMAVDPTSIRLEQRIEAGLASINGVELTPVEQRLEDARRLRDFRAEFSAEVIRQHLSAAREQDR